MADFNIETRQVRQVHPCCPQNSEVENVATGGLQPDQSLGMASIPIFAPNSHRLSTGLSTIDRSKTEYASYTPAHSFGSGEASS